MSSLLERAARLATLTAAGVLLVFPAKAAPDRDFPLGQGATGAVSTHDLSLARTPELEDSAALAHFTESFTREDDGLKMRFDYRLRPGLSTTTNALKLMEMAGLPMPPPGGREHS